MEQNKPFQLDKKELTKELPLVVKPVAGAVIDWLNKADFTHDGIPDMVQFAPYIINAIPSLVQLMPLIHWEKVAQYLLDNFFRGEQDKLAARAILDKLSELIKQVRVQV